MYFYIITLFHNIFFRIDFYVIGNNINVNIDAIVMIIPCFFVVIHIHIYSLAFAYLVLVISFLSNIAYIGNVFVLLRS